MDSQSYDDLVVTSIFSLLVVATTIIVVYVVHKHRKSSKRYVGLVGIVQSLPFCLYELWLTVIARVPVIVGLGMATSFLFSFLVLLGQQYCYLRLYPLPEEEVQ